MNNVIRLLTFKDAMKAATGDQDASEDAKACAVALRGADALDASLVTLRGIHRAIDIELGARTQGGLVCDVLRIGARTAPSRRLAAIADAVDLVAPGSMPRDAKARERKATQLWADCWLALHTWIVDWNRRVRAAAA